MLTQLIPLALYGFACWLVAHFGRDTKFGFWGNLAVAVFLSPIIGLLVLLAQDKRPAAETEEK